MSVPVVTRLLTDSRWRVFALVVLAVAVRVAYWRFAIGDYDPLSDAYQYAELARNVAHGNGLAMRFPSLELHPSAFRPPVFPLLLGGWWAVTGASVGAGQVLNLVIGVGVVLVTDRVGCRIAGPVAGLVGATTVAVFVPLAVNDVTLLAESTSLLLLLLAVLAAINRRPILAGIMVGLLTLTRASAQGAILVVGLWLLWTIGWRRALTFVGVSLLVLTPWITRNWIQLGGPVMLTSNGFNLTAVYSSEAQEIDGFADPIRDPRFDDRRLVQFDELAWDRSLREHGLEGLRTNPSYALTVVHRNLWSWFEIDPVVSDEAEWYDGRNVEVRHGFLPEFWVVTTLGLSGLALMWRRREVILLVALSAYFMVTSLVFLSPPRLRAPFDLVNCIGVGLLAAMIAARGHRRGLGSVAVPTRGAVTDSNR